MSLATEKPTTHTTQIPTTTLRATNRAVAEVGCCPQIHGSQLIQGLVRSALLSMFCAPVSCFAG